MSTQFDRPAARGADVLSRLTGIIRLVVGRADLEVQPEQTFVDDLRIDSLSMVEILVGASRHFAVRIDDEDAKEFVRVRDLVAYLEARLG